MIGCTSGSRSDYEDGSYKAVREEERLKEGFHGAVDLAKTSQGGEVDLEKLSKVAACFRSTRSRLKREPSIRSSLSHLPANIISEDGFLKELHETGAFSGGLKFQKREMPEGFFKKFEGIVKKHGKDFADYLTGKFSQGIKDLKEQHQKNLAVLNKELEKALVLRDFVNS